MIADALAEQGFDVPDDLQPPTVWVVAVPYRDAFGVLSASRKHHMNGLESIEYSEIVAFAERNGYADSIEELEEFVAFIQAQDRTFIEQADLRRTAT